MDEYDGLLKELNKEAAEKKFWRGKKWTEEQIRKMELQGKARLELNQIKSGQEIQQEQMRRQMGLSDTEGLTLTAENMKKLMSDLTNSTHCRCGCGGVLFNGTLYKDFSHFASALIKKYFTKE